MKLSSDIIKDTIRKKAFEHGMTITDLERKSGCKSSVVRQFLNGYSRYLSIESLFNIANTLNCSIDELTGRTVPKDNKTKTITATWDGKLFIEVAKTIKTYLEEKNYNPSFDQVITCLQEAYSFAIENNNKIADERFIKWIVDKFVADPLV